MPVPNQGVLAAAVPIEAARDRRLMANRRRFPARTVHLVDIENLAGRAIPTLREVIDVQVRYARRLPPGADDHVIMASNHLALINAALGWPHARYRVRSGPDGADLELLDVIESENVATRFSRVVIGSGDGMFGHAARDLRERGVRVTVVSRWGSLAPSLERAAMDVVYLDLPLRGIAALTRGPLIPRRLIPRRLIAGRLIPRRSKASSAEFGTRSRWWAVQWRSRAGC